MLLALGQSGAARSLSEEARGAVDRLICGRRLLTWRRGRGRRQDEQERGRRSMHGERDELAVPDLSESAWSEETVVVLAAGPTPQRERSRLHG